MKSDFGTFKKVFTHYQEIFGLNGYAVHFEVGDLTGRFAEITIEQDDMVATAKLNSTTRGEQVVSSAKHEAIHLLLSRLESRALDRFTTGREIAESSEELVRKLERLIR